MIQDEKRIATAIGICCRTATIAIKIVLFSKDSDDEEGDAMMKYKREKSSVKRKPYPSSN